MCVLTIKLVLLARTTIISEKALRQRNMNKLKMNISNASPQSPSSTPSVETIKGGFTDPRLSLSFQEMSPHYFHLDTQTSMTLYKLLEGSAAYLSGNLYEDISFSK